jgi:DNA-binding FadR family transcriptional regulator
VSIYDTMAARSPEEASDAARLHLISSLGRYRRLVTAINGQSSTGSA